MSEQPVLFIIKGACSLGAQITLEWLNISYQVCITDKEMRSSKDFLQINPTGKVGALKDKDIIVTENLAILLYLIDKYNGYEFAAKINTNDRNTIHQWLSYLSSTLHPSFGGALFHKIPLTNDSEEYSQYVFNKLVDVLSFVNQALDNKSYFIGSKPTIVDAQAYALLRWCHKHPKLTEMLNQKAKLGNIKVFLERMEQLDAVKNALSIENEDGINLINSKFAWYYSIK